MLPSECERDIQLELNRNYLKSFPARLKICHIILGALSMGLLIHYSNDHLSLSFVPISVTIVLTLCSLIFLVSSTINWKTSGKIRMARINFIFHTVAIILLVISTAILLIGILVRVINDQYIFRNELPFIGSVLGASATNALNCLLYFLSIKQVRTTCENY